MEGKKKGGKKEPSCIEPELRALSGWFGTFAISAIKGSCCVFIYIKKKKKYSTIFTTENELILLRKEIYQQANL